VKTIYSAIGGGLLGAVAAC